MNYAGSRRWRPSLSPSRARQRAVGNAAAARERVQTNGEIMDERTARIRALNDELRRHRRGGTILITQGVRQLGTAAIADLLDAIAAFESFPPGNDPYGEHDFGALERQGERFFWKIDYYNGTLVSASPDPADPAVTHRVLTLMLASEY